MNFCVQLNIANPSTGSQKLIEIDDDKKLRIFYDKRMSAEVEADALGDEFKGYVFKITGGNDKQGFPMKQGVLVNGRVRLLLKKGHSCFRERRSGEKKRKSVRGCIVGPDVAVLSLVIVKKGEGELPGLTDKYHPRRLGPKRATKIRKLFNLTKEDDVRQYVIKREYTKEREGKKPIKKIRRPKIQRLITERTLRHRLELKQAKVKRAVKRKTEAADYAKLLAARQEEQRTKRQSVVAARRASSKTETPVPAPVKPAAAKGKAAGKGEKPAKPAAGAKAPAKVAAKGAKGAAPAKPAAKGAAPAKPAAKGAAPAKASAKAAAGKPAKPAGDKPAKPAAEKPAKPAAEKPAKPAAEKPAKPAAEKPAKPAADKPAKPAAKEAPAKAAAKAPAKAAAKKAAAKK